MLHDVTFRRRAGRAGRARRPVRSGQDDDRRSWSRGSTTWTGGAVQISGLDVRDVTLHSCMTRSAWSPRTHISSTTRSAPTSLYASPDATEPELIAALPRRPRSCELVDVAARRAGHPGRRARLPAVRRGEAAAGDRPAAAQGADDRGARRGHGAPGLRIRGGGQRALKTALGRDERRGDRAPAVDGP